MDTADTDDVATADDGEVVGTVDLKDGTELPVSLDADLVEQAQAEGVDIGRIADAAVPDTSADVDLTAQTDGDTSSTIPVQDTRQTDLTNRLRQDRDFQFIDDEQIRRLIRQGVDYTERVGEFLLSRDDLIPTVKERLKALIIGEDGISVEPADPDSDADQRLADHLQGLYDDDIRPTEVIDAILNENMMNARAVLRSTDLKELDLGDLDYLRDGITGEEIYVQDRATVHTFDVDEPDDGDADGVIDGVDLETKTIDPQPLVIGEHVFDISLYDHPPLEAVANTAINKMVLQRLKARKAEITSFGAVYAKVEPPSYLPEDQYFDRVDDDDYDGDEDPPTKLERAMEQNIQSAFDTLKDFQSGTVMSVPAFWTLEQLDIPETDDPIDDQIRGYNRDIARRLLVPLDLIELESGSELSRETLFQTLMTTIAGWRREIKRVFDNFADVHADIEGIDGEVDHTFPPLQDANTKQVISALQYAGVAGLGQKEVRQMMNTVQGIDLETDDGGAMTGPPDGSAPPDGGPDDPDDRTQQMRQMLDEVRRGQEDDDTDADTDGDTDADSGPDAVEAASDGVDLSVPDAVTQEAQDALDARDDPDVTVNGMTDTGWNTAEMLAGADEIDENDIVGQSDSMANWWARHFEDTVEMTDDGPRLKGRSKDTPYADNSFTAGKGWGGIPGMRWAFRKAAEITDDDTWRDWVEQIQAIQASDSGNVKPAGGDGQGLKPTPAQAGSDGRLIADSFTPELHPRDPDTGEFIEVPDAFEAALEAAQEIEVDATDEDLAERGATKYQDVTGETLDRFKSGSVAENTLAGIGELFVNEFRTGINFAAGREKDQSSFEVQAAERPDTWRHELGHAIADGHGYGISTDAAREGDQRYNSNDDNFVAVDLDRDDIDEFRLTQQEDRDVPDEVAGLMDAVNDAWETTQEVGQGDRDGDLDDYRMKSNYSALNSHEFLAQLHEELQSDTLPANANWFYRYDDLLPAYLEVAEPSDRLKELITFLHNNRDGSPFDEDPYPEINPEI